MKIVRNVDWYQRRISGWILRWDCHSLYHRVFEGELPPRCLQRESHQNLYFHKIYTPPKKLQISFEADNFK